MSEYGKTWWTLSVNISLCTIEEFAAFNRHCTQFLTIKIYETRLHGLTVLKPYQTWMT